LDYQPQIPKEVGSVYDVVFESPLNKMKDSDVLTGLVQVINTLLPMAADNPGLFDKINMDKAVEMALESVNSVNRRVLFYRPRPKTLSDTQLLFLYM
jgi:hypothetical protein